VRNSVRTPAILMLGLFLAACGGGSGSPSNQSQTSTPNAIIKAVNGVGVSGSGGAVQALLGATIQLSGSASSSSTSTIASYLWTLTSKPSGSTAMIATPSAVTASLAPDVDGSYSIQLQVTDANGITGTQSVTIVVSGTIPITSVVATVQFNGTSTTKPSEAIDVGTVVALDASASSVPTGDAVSISFMMTARPAGSSAALVSSGNSTHFTADVPGTYDVRVRATDQSGDYSDVIYVFQASPAPSAVIVASASPTSGASNVLNAATGYVVVLIGSGSASAPADTVDFTWSLISKPAGSGAALSAATGASVNFIPDLVGNYVVTLVVTDASTGANSTFTTTVEVSQGPTAVVSGIATPVAEANAPSFASSVGVPVTLRGSGSYELGGALLSYSWSLTSVPAGSHASINTPTAANTTFTPDVAGAYIVQLTVTDPVGESAMQSVTVNVGSYPPTVVLSQSQVSALLGGTVSLSAAMSFDQNADPLTFSWSIDSRPAGSTASIIGSTSGSSISFKPDVAGSYTASVTVSNGTLSTIGEVSIASFSAASGTIPLSYAPLLAHYSKATDKLVLIATNPNALHIVDLLHTTDVSVALPAAVKDFSLSADGTRAAVLHEGVVSVVNLSTAALLNSWATGGSQTTVQISNAGLIYLSGQTGGQWVTPGMSVLSAGTGATVATSNGSGITFYGTMQGILSDQVNKIFVVSDGLSPTQIYSISLDPTTGLPTTTSGSPYWGTYPMSGPFWLAGDQSLLFTAAGTYFSTATLNYVGTFSETSQIVSMSHSSTAQEAVVLIESGATYLSNLAYSPSYQRFASSLLFAAPDVPLPLIASAQSYGLDIFHSSTDAHVIVVQTGTSLPNGANAQYFAILR
jgi:PKD domain